MSTDDLVARTRLLDNDCKVMRSGKIHFLKPFSYPLFYPLFTPLLDPFFGSGFGSISGSAFNTFFTRLSKTEKKTSEQIRLMHDINSMKEKIKENKDKVKVNKTLPYLVANVIELLDVDGEDQEEDGANVDLDAQRKG